MYLQFNTITKSINPLSHIYDLDIWTNTILSCFNGTTFYVLLTVTAEF